MPFSNKIGPLFIVLEGIDGAGTTTQLAHVRQLLEARGRRVHTTREPSDGPVGKLVREILRGQHASAAGAVDGLTMALLFAADRRDHLTREVEPALAAGMDVVSDRYLMSSLAYQNEEADLGWVRSLARSVRTPDLTLLLDLPVSVAAERRRNAGRSVERYEHDPFLERVAASYRRLAREMPNVVVLDGAAPREAVTAAVAGELDRILAQGARQDGSE